MLSSLWRDLKVQEKYKTHVSDIQPMKPNSLRLYSTVATIKWLINKYKFYTHNNIDDLFDFIQEECDELDGKIGEFELRK